MDKKTLKQLTTKIYEGFGFIKKDKYYYLDLEDILICSGFASNNGITYLAYNFSVRKAHKKEEYTSNDMFDGFDSFQCEMYFNKNASGYHKKEICIDEWDEEYYSSKLKELLHYYFDPYIEYGLEWVKRINYELGLVHSGELITLSKVAKDFLGIESGNMIQVFDYSKKEGSIFSEMKLLHDMRVTRIINQKNCLIFEYENNNSNKGLFEEYNLDRFKKIVIKYEYEEDDEQRVFLINTKKKKYEEYDLDHFINLCSKKKITLQWLYYFLGYNELYLQFVNEEDWFQEIKFDLFVKNIVYDWIVK